MTYFITFTPDEVRALGWLADRGYCGAENLLGLVGDDGRCELAEHEAWQWRDAADEDDNGTGLPSFTCCGGPLLDKLVSLYDRIV